MSIRPAPSHTSPGRSSRSCCGSQRRRSIADFFDDGRRRNALPALPIEGARRQAEDGVGASFSLELDGDRIAGVSFHSTTCITLVAYCECLAEMVEGLTLRDAVVASARLAEELPAVPAMKQHRAALAGSAFLAAVQKAVEAGAHSHRAPDRHPPSRPTKEPTSP